MTIRLAAARDIPAIMALEQRYFIGNLDPSERVHGFISVLHSQDWMRQAVQAQGVHVAVTDNGLAGFIAVTPPPARSDADATPIVRAMVDLAETVAFAGRPIAQQRYAIRGPVLIDLAARGKGLYSEFNAVTRQAYADRYDVGVLFVAAGNPVSLHTTTSKLGAESLARFDVDGTQYHFLAFRF